MHHSMWFDLHVTGMWATAGKDYCPKSEILFIFLKGEMCTIWVRAVSFSPVEMYGRGVGDACFANRFLYTF